MKLARFLRTHIRKFYWPIFFFFIFISLLIMLISAVTFSPFSLLEGHHQIVKSLIKMIDSLIVSLALLDVSEYLLTKIVEKDEDKKENHKLRESITRFMIVIIVALSLDALLNTLLLNESNQELIYSGVLFIAAVLLLVGLGVFQLLSVRADKIESSIVEQSRDSKEKI